MPFDWRHKLRSLAQVGESLQALASLAVDLRAQLREHQIQLDALYSLAKDPPLRPRYVTVLLLWKGDGPDIKDEPGFASCTLLVESNTVTGCFDNLYREVPAGAWLVAVGAHLSTVMIGNDLIDLAMPPRAPMLQLHRPLQLGVRLRFTLVPTLS